MDLKCLESDYLRRIIFGNLGETKFDGWHFPNCERDYPQQILQQENWTNQRPVLDDKVSTHKEPVFTEQQGQFPCVSRNKKQGGENRNYANIVRKGNLNQQAELNVPTSNYWALLN